MGEEISVYALDSKTVEQLDNAFKYHTPKGDQAQKYQSLREVGKELAKMICHYSPPSRERSLALTKLEEAIMWANAGIARNE